MALAKLEKFDRKFPDAASFPSFVLLLVLLVVIPCFSVVLLVVGYEVVRSGMIAVRDTLEH